MKRLTKKNYDKAIPYLPSCEANEEQLAKHSIMMLLFLGQIEDLMEEANIDYDELFEMLNDLGGKKDVLSS